MKLKQLSTILFVLFIFVGKISADWEKMAGQMTGNVHTIAEYEGKIFIGTTNGVLKSEDGGNSWVNINDGLLDLYVNSITVLGENVYAGTEEAGVFVSTNWGDSWEQINSGITTLNITAIIANETELYAGTSGGGIFKSTNYGTTWIAQNSGLNNLKIYSMYSVNSNFYTTTEKGGVYIWDLSQNRWVSINNGLPTDFTVFSIVKSNSNLIIGTEIGAFYSNDDGEHWIAGNAGILYNNNNVYTLKYYDNKVFAGTDNGGLYRSVNDGNSWEEIFIDNTSSDILEILLINNQLFACINSDGLFRSENWGENWTSLIESSIELNDPLARRFLYTDSKLFVATYGGKIYLSNTDGNSWQDITQGVICDNAYDFAEVDSFVFVSTDNGIYRTNKNNINWQVVNSETIGGSLLVLDKNIYVGTRYGGVYFSSNCGDTWVNKGLIGEIVMALSEKDNYIYAGTAEACYFSTNNGNNWINTGQFPSRINKMAIKGDYIYAGTHYNGILRSKLGETNNWESINPMMTWPPVLFVTFYNNYMMVCTVGYGILISDNDGISFSQLNSGFPIYATAYSVIATESYLFAGLTGGVYRQNIVENLMDIVEVEEEKLVVTSFTLSQNYPNPFNPTTTIAFSIANTENVTLKIYDVLGKEVATLIDEQMQAGNYQQQWDAANYASGQYFYRLQAGNFSSTKKLMLVK
ncbi:MAG: T9SS type A sorting domain-containing protein [bacterium]